MNAPVLHDLEQLLDRARANGATLDATWLAQFETALHALGTDHSQTELELDALADAIHSPAPDPILPELLRANPKFNDLYNTLIEIRQFAAALAKGDLGAQPQLYGYTAGALKKLQSNLQRLTRQTQMIAAGDLSQRVEFMGEFSDAFNAMVARLEETLTHLTRDEIELTQRHTELLREIAERKRAEQTERDLRMLSEALRDTAAALNSTLDLDQVLDHIVDQIGRVISYDAVNIVLIDQNAITFARGRGHPGDLLARMTGLQWRAITSWRTMAETRAPFVISDTHASSHWSRDVPESAWIRSYVGAPITRNDQVLGFLNLDSRTPGFFNYDHAEHLQAFADQAALAIENARLYAQLQQAAITDPLTGIFNRRQLMDMIARELDRLRRCQRPFSILLFDIDHFKNVNDTLGHSAGDRVLQVLVERCVAHLRGGDFIGRYGGEEFMTLLPETGLAEARMIAERLRACIADAPIETDQGGVSVTVSIGVAGWEGGFDPHANHDARDHLIERADRALYQAKAAGRNRVFV